MSSTAKQQKNNRVSKDKTKNQGLRHPTRKATGANKNTNTSKSQERKQIMSTTKEYMAT